MNHEAFPQVLLKKVVNQFDDLIGRFGEHAVAAGEEVYIQPCVYLSFHLVQMRAASWTDVDFDQLAAVSGASALFAYQPGEFMQKYANLSIGMDKRIAGATGFGYEWMGFQGVDGAWKLLQESIDSGRPVKGWHYENVMFGGYQDAAETEGRKIFAMADGPDTFATWWTWQELVQWVELVTGWGATQLGRHTERVQTEPPNQVALRVIKDLVAWSVDPPPILREKYPAATFGLAGIQAYAADCANTEKYEDWSACHDINPQWTVRNSTAVYLTRLAAADLFPAEVNAHLLAAAEQYRAAYVDWQAFYDQLGHGALQGAGKLKDRRLAGAAAIYQALEHEEAAIAELRKALEAESIQVSAWKEEPWRN